MSTRSNKFANTENKFEFVDKDQITCTALSFLGELLDAIDMQDSAKSGSKARCGRR